MRALFCASMGQLSRIGWTGTGMKFGILWRAAAVLTG